MDSFSESLSSDRPSFVDTQAKSKKSPGVTKSASNISTNAKMATEATTAANIIKDLASRHGDAWAPPPSVAATWVATVKTGVSYTGTTESFVTALCYHALKNTASESIAKDTPVALPGLEGVKHADLIHGLGRWTFRQMMTRVMMPELAELEKVDEVKAILEARAPTMGLDSSNWRLANDCLHPDSLTHAEKMLRSNASDTAIAKHAASQRRAEESTVNRARNAKVSSDPVAERAPSAPMGWAG